MGIIRCGRNVSPNLDRVFAFNKFLLHGPTPFFDGINMSENSKIEWTDHMFNPWEGCQKVGPGCDHCYAETRNARFAGGVAINWGPGAPRRRMSLADWREPVRWNAAHAEFFAADGGRQRVFCPSLADVCDNARSEEH